MGLRPGRGRARRDADEGAFADAACRARGRGRTGRSEPLGDAEHPAPGVLFARRACAARDVLAHACTTRGSRRMSCRSASLIACAIRFSSAHALLPSIGDVNVGQQVGLGPAVAPPWRRDDRSVDQPWRPPASIASRSSRLQQTAVQDPADERAARQSRLALAASPPRRGGGRSSRRPRNAHSSGTAATWISDRAAAFARPVDRLPRGVVDIEEIEAVDLVAPACRSRRRARPGCRATEYELAVASA